MNAGNQSRPQHQTNWDWRAAGNFIGGGAGSGLLLFAAISSVAGVSSVVPVGAALALIALGLFCVWLEIGRPWRSMNVMLHARTSWMTRESLVAPFLFGSGLIALATGSAVALWLGALLAMLFLYCQARILNAAKGIPAWRQKLVVPLIVATGLTEGVGLLALLTALAGAPRIAWLPSVLLFVLMVRALLWRAYRRKLATRGAPQQALAVLDRLELPFIKIGHWALVPVLLLVLLQPTLASAQWLTALAGLVAVAGGWLFKYTLIVRAGYNQGYALAQVPVRGSANPGSGLASRPGWNKF
ncbi:dimethyl sulfoxide reductase anchor subunit [Herminiimonas sp. CN]|uniref:dimethyl sulfoxide reductase anchor subunit n=1 Tax=Herminiimonas sp. CN TaxID=1349818 RepID=UPI0004734660|nr:dimethyl sulfoxide reductase anchor subunit [Herminiimonas sp. CN]